MLDRGVQTRNLLTLLLVVAIPFCCCNFRVLLGGDPSSQSASLSEDERHGAGLNPAADLVRTTPACCHEKSAGDRRVSSGRSEREPANEPDDCSCDKTVGKILLVQKTILESPAQIVVAVLDWGRPAQLRPHNSLSGREPRHQPTQRPPTSLLRMHCALIV